MARPRLGRAAWPILAVVLAIKLVFVFTTGYQLRHDARDYDRHAVSIAAGEGYPDAKAPGRATAFRPPAYPVLLAGAYLATGVADAPNPDRIVVARVLSALLGTAAVALIGLLSAQLWGRRAGLVATALAAVFVPLTLVSGSVMSEALFVPLLLGAVCLAAAFPQRRHPARAAALIGVVLGLTVLTRANAAVLVLPLAWAVWGTVPRERRTWAAPAALAACAALVVAPWTVRNYLVFHTVVPVTTQLGSAMIGTYNDQARSDPDDPAAWRGLRRLRLQGLIPRTPETDLERELRDRALRYAADHPGYVAEVAFWNTARMLDLAGLAKARATTSTLGISGYWADWSLPCFWAFALLALAGAFTRRARAAPRWVWAVPLLLYLGVVFLVVETPRYRAGIDAFVILLAALAVTAALDRGRRRRCASATSSPARSAGPASSSHAPGAPSRPASTASGSPTTTTPG